MSIGWKTERKAAGRLVESFPTRTAKQIYASSSIFSPRLSPTSMTLKLASRAVQVVEVTDD